MILLSSLQEKCQTFLKDIQSKNAILISDEDWIVWLNCTVIFSKVGSLAWNASETAEFYIVTAENNIGHKVQLSTNDTWTYISEFHCGQEYFLSVQAADSVCTSRPSPPLNLTSGKIQFILGKICFQASK